MVVWGRSDVGARRVRKAALMAIVAGVLLSGCAGGGPTPITYDLSLPANGIPRTGGTSAQILVREPRALKALDSERLIVRPQAQEITYLGGAQLPDRLPVVVQARLIEAFERSNGAGAVAAPGDGLVIDVTLAMQLRRFEVLAFDGDRVEIEIFVNLINEGTGRVLGKKGFQASLPTSSGDADAVVSALNTAFGMIAEAIVTWTYATI